jgi:pimeloyl-ACP methyl ester carboxylesterase
MGSSSSFNYITNELAEKFHVTAIDLPGHGDSNLQIPFDLNNLTYVVEEFINEKFSSPIDVIGYSLGGTIANNIAATQKELLNSIILIDPWFSNNTTTDSLAFKFLSVIEKNAKKSWVEPKDSLGYVKNMNSELTEDKQQIISKNRFDYDIRIWDNSIQKGTLINMPQNSINTSVLLIKPSMSLIKEMQINKINENFENIIIEEVPNTTHMIIFENPEEISKLVSEFVK